MSKQEELTGCYGGGKDWWKNTYASFDNGELIVKDIDVAKFTKKHMRFIDRLDIRKVVAAAMYSFSILSHSVEEPSNKKNWKYFKDV